MVNCENPYAQARLADGTIDFSDPVFADAAQKLMQLVDMGAFPEKFLETGEVEAVQNFAEGQAVLFPHQSTIVCHLMDEMGSDAISVEQFPGYTQRSDDDGKYMVDINHTLTPGLSISLIRNIRMRRQSFVWSSQSGYTLSIDRCTATYV